MDDQVMLRAYAETIKLKDAEIEHLKFLNQEERQTIDDLAKLCTRAADALEDLDKISGVKWYPSLIAELRKAAQ
jgi:hypothetical protein